MSRVILVLVLAAVVFTLVWTMAPNFVQDFVPRVAKSPAANTEDTAKAATTPTTTKPLGRKRTVTTPGNSPTSEANPGTTSPALSQLGASQTGVPPTNGPIHQGRPVFSVATDSATLYSTNATAGTVVSYLRKGEIVEPQFILNSAGQEWMFVSVADRRVSGFLRVEMLGKKQADQTSR